MKDFTSMNSSQRAFETKRALCLAEKEYYKNRQDVIMSMKQMNRLPDSLSNYELVYDSETGQISAEPVRSYRKGRVYFTSKEEAYACLIAVGEDRIRTYYFGVRERSMHVKHFDGVK